MRVFARPARNTGADARLRRAPLAAAQGRQRRGLLGPCAALLLAAGCQSSAFAQPRGDASSQRSVVLDLDDRASSVGALRDRPHLVPDGGDEAPDPAAAAYSGLLRDEALRHIRGVNRCALGDGGAFEFDGACVCNELCTFALPPGTPGDAITWLEWPGLYRLTFARRTVTRCELLRSLHVQQASPGEHLCASSQRPRRRAPR